MFYSEGESILCSEDKVTNRPETCAVVVTYNRKDKLKKCIDGLLAQKFVSTDIIIINNASTDGTEEMVLSEYVSEGFYYINTGANLGGAGGFERGVKEAVLKDYKYIWLMDDDTWPSDTALFELLKTGKALKENWGFLSSVAYWTDGSICRMNIQKSNIFRHIGKREYSMEYAPIKMCSFVSLLVKSDVVKDVGLPIGDYFIWTDDYEFTGRISQKYSCYMVPSSHVIHAMNRHTRVNFATDDSDRIERYQYIYRNDVHCYKQYGLMGVGYIVLKDGYTILNILLNSQSNKMKKIKVLWNGVMEGITYNPEIKRV
ncbi:MAG: glycosyltransferase family 2 protein [Butyrivibrio sp.]|uniref:glycosyltransferase family 2 protein n=1 Tax=Butyrivibrio sp. TaxID=28121 RepID=UPI0025B9E04B|nr:glycosyltransferase family 2 protein [Butyrivibrio sp.]MBQ6587461.1 glycosyltransferase family 2 protein [Butyrivibrio sp.]